MDALNSYIQLLDLISQDTSLKSFLLKNVKTSSCVKSEFTKDDLPQVIICILHIILVKKNYFLGEKFTEKGYHEKICQR